MRELQRAAESNSRYSLLQIIPQDLLKKYIMYAKEMIKPKLHQLDQEKLARLYSDLRRESLATGSFPITVRHLESMIRMAEASAKMNLREYVRSDDIDLAIQVTVGSFVNAQKISIKKTLERVSSVWPPHSRHGWIVTDIVVITFTGLPEIRSQGDGSRRVARLFAGSVGQGKGSAGHPAARSGACQCRGCFVALGGKGKHASSSRYTQRSADSTPHPPPGQRDGNLRRRQLLALKALHRQRLQVQVE